MSLVFYGNTDNIDNVPNFYFTPSTVLIMRHIFTAHPQMYTDSVPHFYCAPSDVPIVRLIFTAHPEMYW